MKKLEAGLAVVWVAAALTACSATPRQPASALQASAARPAANASHSSVAGKPAASARSPGGQAHFAAPAKNFHISAGAAQPDWTGLFKDWENGCANSPELDAFEKQFAVFDRERGLVFSKVNLAAPFKAATGMPVLRYRHDYSSYILPVTAGSYYGIALRSIEFYAGHENGIAGKQLVLGASEKQVRQALKKKKATFRKRQGHGAVISGNALETLLICDRSD